MAVRRKASPPSPTAQWRTFLASYTPSVQRLVRAARTALRRRMPTANELAYDYGFSVVLAYSASESAVDGIVGLAVKGETVRLYFTHGKALKDPAKRLQGTGRQTRYLVLANARQLAEPEVAALIRAAIAHNRVPLPRTGGGQMIIKSGGATRAAKRRSK